MAAPPARRRQPVPPRPHRPLPRGPRPSRARGRLAVLVGVPLLVVLALLGLRVAYADHALPGTQLAGDGVSGDSRAALERRVRRLAVRPVVVVAGDRTVRVTPAQAGYLVDVDATVQRVLDAGRHGPLGGLGATAAGLVGTHDVAVVAQRRPAVLAATVARIAGQVDRVPYPGSISVDPVALQAAVQPPRAGRTVRRERLRRDLLAAFATGRPAVRAQLQVTPAPPAAAVQAVARQAERYAAAPLRLTGAGRTLTVPGGDVAPVLALRAAGPGRVRLGVDRDRLQALVAGVAARRDRRARPARLSAPTRPVVLDGKGKLSWRPRRARVRLVRAGRAGRTVQQAGARSAIAAAVAAGRHRATLPVTKVAPAVTAASARRIDQLIGTFTTHYVPGQPRVTNIRRMAATVDGTLIAPGAQFSLNGIVGPRTTAGGYVKAPFIADGKIVPSVGGGVSQFSTTMYNAAYFAGLRIDTHQPHSIFIDRYPAGRESTLDYPGIDLKWTNDTGVPIFIRTASDADSVTVSLYGHNGGRRVTATPGPREPNPGGDFQITVTRTVRYPDGRVAKDAFTSRYDKPPAGE